MWGISSRARRRHQVGLDWDRAYLCEQLEPRRLLAFAVPVMSSLPGAFHTLYLDFDGDVPQFWRNNEGEYFVSGPGGVNDPIPAFDWDGNQDNLNTTEAAALNQIFQTVAEKFAPFAVNVTTVDPGTLHENVALKVQVGGRPMDWYDTTAPFSSGVAAIGGFDNPLLSNISFTFANQYVNNAPFIANVIAHEAGHTLGMTHQRWGRNPPPVGDDSYPEYYRGDAVRGPIMGDSNAQVDQRKIWWRTNHFPGQNSPDGIGDEVAFLTTSFNGRRNDDHPFDVRLVPNADGTLAERRGIIETENDADFFRFTALSPRATIYVRNAEFGGMLAPVAQLRNAANNAVVPATVYSNNFSSTIEAGGLTPGTEYVVRVASNGEYGSLGGYRVSGAMQTFATHDAAGRRVSVGGLPGNNNVSFSLNPFTDRFTVSNSVNGGPTTSQTFPLSQVDFVNVSLGNGDDVVSVGGLFKNGNVPIGMFVAQGGGNDVLRVPSPGSFTTFNVDGFHLNWTIANDRTMRLTTFDQERIEIFGTLASDVLNVNRMPEFGAPQYHFFADDSNDTLNIGPRVVGDAAAPLIFFHGQGGTGDTMTVSAATLQTRQSFTVHENDVTWNRFGDQNQADFDATVERVTVTGTDFDDSLVVDDLAAGKTVNLFGGGGSDVFSFGFSDPFPQQAKPWSANNRGFANVFGGGGDADRVVVDDLSWGSLGNYIVGSNTIQNAFVNNAVSYDTAVELVDVLTPGGATVTVSQPLLGQRFNLFNEAGGGAGSLVLDDRSQFADPFELDLRGDRIVRRFNTAGTPTPQEIAYDGFEAVTVFANDATTSVNVYGTSPDVTSQTTVVTGGGDDTVTVYPHGDPALIVPGEPEVLTIATPLGVGGGAGADSFIVDNTAVPFPTEYVFTNLFGAGTANIVGLGPAAVGAADNVENVVVRGGAGADVFRLNSFRSGTALDISAGAGDDTLHVGNGNVAGNVTAISSFNFDGQDGLDAFNLENTSDGNQWTYTNDASAVWSQRVSGTPYSVGLGHANTEQLTLNTGPGVDALVVNAVQAGQALAFNAGEGNDALYLPAGAADVAGPILYDGGGGTLNTLSQPANLATGLVTVHLTQDTYGGHADDNLFGPGAYVRFGNVHDMSLTPGGSGADTIHAQPNAFAAVSLYGGEPSDAPGDTLVLDFAYAVEPSFTAAANGGTYVFASHQPLAYADIETAVVNTVPAWLNAAAEASWNPADRTLTVWGVATIIGDPGADAPLITATGTAALLTIEPAAETVVRLAGLSLSGGATVRVSAAGPVRTLVLDGLSITGDSRLDLTDNAMVLRQGSPSSVEGWLRSGFNAGAWDGPGIQSSSAAASQAVAALGNATGASLGLSSFNGVQGLDAGDVLVAHTYYGDTNLDQLVNTDDILNILAAGKLDTGVSATWSEGDMNFDGRVDTDDILQILAAGRLDQA